MVVLLGLGHSTNGTNVQHHSVQGAWVQQAAPARPPNKFSPYMVANPYSPPRRKSKVSGSSPFDPSRPKTARLAYQSNASGAGPKRPRTVNPAGFGHVPERAAAWAPADSPHMPIVAKPQPPAGRPSTGRPSSLLEETPSSARGKTTKRDQWNVARAERAEYAMQQALSHVDELENDVLVSERTIKVMREQAEYVESELDKSHRMIHELQEQLMREQAENRAKQCIISGCSSCSQKYKGQTSTVTPTAPYSSNRGYVRNRGYGALDNDGEQHAALTLQCAQRQKAAREKVETKRMQQDEEPEQEVQMVDNLRDELLNRMSERLALEQMKSSEPNNEQAEASDQMREQILEKNAERADPVEASEQMREQILNKIEERVQTKESETAMLSSMREELLDRMSERVAEESGPIVDDEPDIRDELRKRTLERAEAGEAEALLAKQKAKPETLDITDEIVASVAKRAAAEEAEKASAQLRQEISASVSKRAAAQDAQEAAVKETDFVVQPKPSKADQMQAEEKLRAEIMQKMDARAKVGGIRQDISDRVRERAMEAPTDTQAAEIVSGMKSEIMKRMASRERTAEERTANFLQEALAQPQSAIQKYLALEDHREGAEALSKAFKQLANCSTNARRIMALKRQVLIAQHQVSTLAHRAVSQASNDSEYSMLQTSFAAKQEAAEALISAYADHKSATTSTQISSAEKEVLKAQQQVVTHVDFMMQMMMKEIDIEDPPLELKQAIQWVEKVQRQFSKATSAAESMAAHALVLEARQQLWFQMAASIAPDQSPPPIEPPAQPEDMDTLAALQAEIQGSMQRKAQQMVQAEQAAQKDPRLVKIQNAPNRFMLLAAPQSGKTELLKKVASQYGIDHICAGQLLRDEVAAGSKIGERVEWHLQEKKPVPDDIVTSLVLSRLSSSECGDKGWVLDGFPRNKAQARALSAAEFAPNRVFLLDMDKDALIAKCEEEESDVSALAARVDESMQSMKEIGKMYWTVVHRLSAQRAAQIVYADVNGIISGKPQQLMMLGAPGTGKGRLVMKMATEMGLVHITKDSLIRSLSEHDAGVKARKAMDEGGMSSVPDEVFAELLKIRLAKGDCTGCGWLLDGWPNSRESIEMISANGTKPQVVILSLSEQDALDAHVHVRYGVENHKKYDMRTNPPPEGVQVRSNPTNTADKVRGRHMAYESSLRGILSVMPGSDELVIVDGSQSLDSMFAGVQAALYESGKKTTVEEHQAALSKARAGTGPVDEKDLAAQSIQAQYRGHKERKVPRASRQYILIGPPASGKGTQARMLMKTYGVVHISTGSLLRDHIARETEVGLKVKPFVESGGLVPDEMMIEMVNQELDTPAVRKNGWLLDGYPRTEAQADAMKIAGIKATAFIVLDTPAHVLVERAIHRRVDPETGIIYHLVNNPPPANRQDIIDRLVTRADDEAEKVKERVNKYDENIDAVIAVFKQRLKGTMSLARIDGCRSPEFVFEDVRRVVESKPWQVMLFGDNEEQEHVQAQMLVSKLGVELIDVQKLSKERKPKNDKELMQILRKETSSHKCTKNGWLLMGMIAPCPDEVRQLKEMKVIADKVVQINVDDADDESDSEFESENAEWLGEFYPKRVVAVRPNISDQAVHEDIIAGLYGAIKLKAARTARRSFDQQWTRPIRKQPSGFPWKLFVTSAPVPEPTTASLISTKLYQQMGISPLSHQHLYREVKLLDAELFAEAKTCRKQEGSLSTDLTIRILQLISNQGPCATHGWILEGFPRNEAEVDAVKAADLEVDYFINIDLPIEVMEERLAETDTTGNEAQYQRELEMLSDHTVNTGQMMEKFRALEMKVDGDGEEDEVYKLIDNQLNRKLIG